MFFTLQSILFTCYGQIQSTVAIFFLYSSFHSRHINNTANAVPSMHVTEPVIDLCQGSVVRDVFVNFDFAGEIVCNEARDLCPAFDTTKRGSAPGTTSHQLEGPSRDFLARSGNADNGRYTPSFMARFQCSAHHIDITSTIERIIQPSIGDLDEVLLNCRGFRQLCGIDKVRCTKLARPGFFVGVRVNGNDARCTDEGRSS